MLISLQDGGEGPVSWLGLPYTCWKWVRYTLRVREKQPCWELNFSCYHF